MDIDRPDMVGHSFKRDPGEITVRLKPAAVLLIKRKHDTSLRESSQTQRHLSCTATLLN